MTKTKVLLLSAVALFLAAPLYSSSKVLCSGFLPENSMRIPVTAFQNGGITNAEFNKVLDQLDAYYRPVIAAKGATLQINRKWDDATVNASAEQNGRTWVLNMYGGLARHPAMNADGFMLVACHETGHHLGGAPKIEGWFGFGGWASNEGEADYYSTLRCLRFMFHDADNAAFVANNTINATLKTKCEEVYDTQAEENLCMRVGMAGFVTADLFKSLAKLTVAPSFDTPDNSSVSSTDNDHPAPQCRLDTYFQGGLCRHDVTVPLSDADPTVGTCAETASTKIGTRPHCWFKP